jgi:ADP-ribose pyrophosphatase
MSDRTLRPKLGRKRLTYRTPFMDVLLTRADFGTFSKDYYVVTFGERGGLIGVKGGKILLVKQYRFLPGACSWELPGGTIGQGEKAAVGLARECLEETGLRPRRLKRLLVYYPGLDNVDNRTSIYISEKLERVRDFHPNPAEVREIGWFGLDRCLKMVFAGEILDAMTVAGILAYRLHLDRRS